MTRLTPPAVDQTLDLALEQVEPWLHDALRAWVDTGAHTYDHDGVPVVSDFLERYQGEYEDFEDFCQQWIDCNDYHQGWPEEAQRYFDFDRFVRDQRSCWTVADAPEGVFVYSL